MSRSSISHVAFALMCVPGSWPFQGRGVLELDVGTQRVEEAYGEQLGLLSFGHGLVAVEEHKELLLVSPHHASY